MPIVIEDAILSSPAWAALAGPFVGSLLGVLVRRLPAGRPVAIARSACETCGHVLGAAELVPILSFLWLRGRCAKCGARIAPQHLFIELSATAVAVWAIAADVRGPLLWADCVFGWVLLALGWIDWDRFRLPDVLTLPLLLAGLAVTARLDPVTLTEHAAAAAGGYVLFRLVAGFYRLARGRAGLGEGDAKLMAAIGAWVGIGGLSSTLLAGALLGLVFGLGRVAARRGSLATAIPFGPFLAIGAWLTRIYLMPA